MSCSFSLLFFWGGRFTRETHGVIVVLECTRVGVWLERDAERKPEYLFFLSFFSWGRLQL